MSGRTTEETRELLLSDSMARDRAAQTLAETPGGEYNAATRCA